jgi:hypothetical protein
MTRARRLLVVLVALALPLAVAETASGAPDCDDLKFADNPACTSDPELYDMTMEFIGEADGLATICGGPVEMETSNPLDFVSTGVVEIWIREPDYEFEPLYSDPISGYDGCHGPAVFPPDDPVRQGLLMINVDDTGFAMMWHFDWYFGEEPHPKNPRKTVAVWEHPSLATAGYGDGEMLDVTWDIAEDGTRSAIVSGPFVLVVSGSDYDGFVLVNPDPEEPEEQPEELTFLVTLTPKSG